MCHEWKVKEEWYSRALPPVESRIDITEFAFPVFLSNIVSASIMLPPLTSRSFHEIPHHSCSCCESSDSAKYPGALTAIGWYGSYPNQYAGERDKASVELGRLTTEHRLESLTKTLRAIKADKKTLELQKEFFDRVV